MHLSCMITSHICIYIYIMSILYSPSNLHINIYIYIYLFLPIGIIYICIQTYNISITISYMATFQPPSSLCANLGDPSDLLGDLARLGGPNNLLALWAWVDGRFMDCSSSKYIYIIYISKISKIIHVHNIYIYMARGSFRTSLF